ncbi:MAG: UDP-N-acetylmuramoyl-L-alanine--D-glutamate ligase, partial [Solirubrobacteraceae bacterium]
IAPDHLDRHGTMDSYTQAKLKLFAHQSPQDIAVLPSDPAQWDPKGLAQLNAHQVRFGGPDGELSEREGYLWWREGTATPQPLLQSGQLSLRGRHNLANAMAAAAVCLARGLDIDAVRHGLCTFPGVPHRLEEIAQRGGVMYVNDSKATNVASTLVALDALPGTGIHLILGGQAKGQDFAALREPISKRCEAVYLIGQDAQAIASALEGIEVPVCECGELERALASARQSAGAGAVVLLSPACASFDQFADFEARGECFRELVLAF